MWNEEELLAEIDAYFDQVTEVEFMKDVMATGSLDLIEDIMISKHVFSIFSKTNGLIKYRVADDVKIKNQQFDRLASTFRVRKPLINKQIDNVYIGIMDEYYIGA